MANQASILRLNHVCRY